MKTSRHTPTISQQLNRIEARAQSARRYEEQQELYGRKPQKPAAPGASKTGTAAAKESFKSTIYLAPDHRKLEIEASAKRSKKSRGIVLAILAEVILITGSSF